MNHAVLNGLQDINNNNNNVTMLVSPAASVCVYDGFCL